VVSIVDDGPGIPALVRDHLFDPFMTTKPQGRGLGLALVARIVADHGGAIDVSSEPRRTRFDVMLPVASGAVAS
jgi:two-component system nitrogen regulation sensor histidine kinase GlnL